MNKINIEAWGKFKVSKLFKISPTKNYGLNNSKLFENEGDIPVVVNSSYNNGIGGFVSLKATEKGNMITFSDTTTAAAIFYQKDDFVGYSHVQGMYPIKDNWSMNSLLFFLTVFKKQAYLLGFDYINKFTRVIASNMEVRLPIKPNGKIDFEYMDRYIEDLSMKSHNYTKNLITINNNIETKLDSSRWGVFHIYDFFVIDSGNSFDAIKMTEVDPKISFINRSGKNNGISTIVDEIDGVAPYEPGLMTLSLGGSLLGSCFIQDDPFYTGQNVAVLKPKLELSSLTKLFIATAITKESRNNYKAFIKELNKYIKTTFSFKLPIKEDGSPDFEYIERYMKDLIENKKIEQRIKLFE